ncbi:hypothetical protein Q4489_13585 [Thalassotalea sp. 1_MG-2023]|uniref:DUF6942 family protein n=1 Tax=Thalassotalea sp. 1_MG-2023 TaxID=3062680 RepID=UPI0026E48598|nr:hypothetical protein [Thalassotalea sp. 1_MG-2023]MDO6428047.1 hypothetical protein [Thalassotalea sp. 1_MG-2023]
MESTPNIDKYLEQSTCRFIELDEINAIGQQAGNGWRKVFNVYAKFIYELSIHEAHPFKSWQQFRDKQLLQAGSSLCLWLSCSAEQLNSNLNKSNSIHIVMGKGYASKLSLAEQCFWLSEDFAINSKQHLIICPYFDYRQLTNEKITYLCQLLKQSFPDFYKALS